MISLTRHLCVACLLMVAPTLSATAEKPRVIVTTDGETDDRCSMNRFLLYANDFEVLGLIHSSSKHHWKGDANHPEKKWEPVSWLDRQLDAYEAVYPSLRIHDADYPTPDYLRSQVFVGNIAYEGEMEAVTPGSQRIVEVLLEDNPAPVWLQAWGGPNTIARALKSIEEVHPERIADISKKVRLYLISEQDGTNKSYIRGAWPDILVLRCGADTYGTIAYRWMQHQPEPVHAYFDKAWMTGHITEGHGPLTALYETKDGRFRSEGDSPAFLHTINTGLRSTEDPRYGGWGGRFAFSGGMWRTVDEDDTPPHSLIRWAIDFQNDWAARADWCVTSFEDANHPPQVKVAGALDRTAKVGTTISLDARESSDPDDNALSFSWWHYGEADSYPGDVVIDDADGAAVSLQIPEDAKAGDTIHIVCTATDDGSPTLRRHARIIVTITD